MFIILIKKWKDTMSAKNKFKKQLESFIKKIQEHVSTQDGQWSIKGFIDVFQKEK